MSGVKNTLLNSIYSNWKPGDHKPIFIIGHGRSGTSWIGDTLSQASNVLQYHEPCNPISGRDKDLNQLWFVHIPKNGANKHFSTYLNMAKNGLIDIHSAFWTRNKANYLHRLMPGYRILIKEVASVMSVEWILNNFPHSGFLYVLRHPCAVASSERKRKIDPHQSVQLLLKDEGFVKHCPGNRLELLKQAGTAFEKYGAIWSVRNGFFNDIYKESSLNFVKYEDLALDPVTGFKGLYDRFDLPWTDKIEEYILKNTNESNTDDYATTRIASAQVDKWKKELSEKEIQEVMNFTLPFGLDFYNRESDFI